MQESLSPVPAITLRQVFADYVSNRDLSPKTILNYEQRLNSNLSDWLDIPLSSISKSMVLVRYKQIAKRGKTMATTTMRTLRALFAFAAVMYEDDKEAPIFTMNPTSRLTELKCWYQDKTRRDVINESDLAPWFRAVLSLENTSMRDYLITLILTGMRKSEALNLRWNQVNLNAGTISLLNHGDDRTKNGKDHVIPLTDYLWTVLKHRKHLNNSEYVFGSRTRNAPISVSTKYIDRVTKRSGVEFRLHDLRRTFATTADDLEIDSNVVKNLLNHTVNDITQLYTCRSIERLRRDSQRITNHILFQAGIREREVRNAAAE